MPTTIKKIQAEDKESVEDILNIKIVRKIAEETYVVADETSHALLRTSQDLEENGVYKLLKPKYRNSVLEANPKLKLLKVSQKDLKQYEVTIESPNQANCNEEVNLNTFTKCDALEVNAKTEYLTVLIVSKSGDIVGMYGKYNIVTAKDCNADKNSIAIYHDKKMIVTVGKLLTFTTLKKTSFKADGSATGNYVEFKNL